MKTGSEIFVLLDCEEVREVLLVGAYMTLERAVEGASLDAGPTVRFADHGQDARKGRVWQSDIYYYEIHRMVIK